MLIDHMRQGYSFESFGADISVHRDTLYEWIKQHPEFSDAKKVGSEKCYKVWEAIGLEASKGRLNGASAAIWIFNMKNRFGWKDKQEISGPGDKPLTLVLKKWDDGDTTSAEAD